MDLIVSNSPAGAGGWTGAQARAAAPSGPPASATSSAKATASPRIGSFPLREIFYRADRMAKPALDPAARGRWNGRRLVRCAG